MINVINNYNNPYFNLALEEYFLKYKDLQDDILILWQNEPVIVIGKNQNTYEELNLHYVDSKNIKVVRRLSGGGAVYHDLGNLNFTIIESNSNIHKNDFSFFALPVISCLSKLRIKATFSGRNDILIDGKKFSGNAQYFYKDKLLHHGTLLFISDLTVLSKALNVKKDKFQSKGIKSVGSRVTNISDYIDLNIPLKKFKDMIIKSIFEDKKEKVENYVLTNDDIEKVNELVKNKYGTWEWNFGKSSKFNYKKEMRFNSRTVSIMMNVVEGIIKNFKIYGDFFEENPVEELEKLFINKRFEIVELKDMLKKINISNYILNLNNKDFIQLFL
ncbi:lipoate--protein ligase [Clostridium sporogenes]|uniref:lipoate--protein ligase n=1 Tax=Clostridium sporogenes TaxID=1509 RepID=UPI0022388BF8|nr:lipoate--protein ligase [Clostridium sporogenes]MCW6074672.1 lipoate--protein ligase [Clostridium sporogenes]